jgi:hypothetical protein
MNFSILGIIISSGSIWAVGQPLFPTATMSAMPCCHLRWAACIIQLFKCPLPNGFYVLMSGGKENNRFAHRQLENMNVQVELKV